MENFYKNFLRKIQKTLNIDKLCPFCEIQNTKGNRTFKKLLRNLINFKKQLTIQEANTIVLPE